MITVDDINAAEAGAGQQMDDARPISTGSHDCDVRVSNGLHAGDTGSTGEAAEVFIKLDRRHCMRVGVAAMRSGQLRFDNLKPAQLSLLMLLNHDTIPVFAGIAQTEHKDDDSLIHPWSNLFRQFCRRAPRCKTGRDEEGKADQWWFGIAPRQCSPQLDPSQQPAASGPADHGLQKSEGNFYICPESGERYELVGSILREVK